MSAYLLQFYQRRLVRLAPSLMLCLVPTVILLTFLVPSWWPNKNDWYDTGAYSVFGVSNLYLAFQESEGYFDTEGGSQMNPFLHTWSLGVEEQFYLIYPVVMYLGTSSTSTSSFCRVSTWVVAFALVSLVISVVLTFTASEKIGFYFSPARFWEMAAGEIGKSKKKKTLVRVWNTKKNIGGEGEQRCRCNGICCNHPSWSSHG